MTRCAACPVGDSQDCLAQRSDRFGHLCALAASGDPVQRQHVIDRSAIGLDASPPPPPPSLLGQAASLGKAIVAHVAAGLPRVDAAELGRRLALCHGCDRYRPDPPRCLACGCYVQIKAAWADQRCPLGRWEAAEAK